MPFLALCKTAVDADLENIIIPHLKDSIYSYLKTDTLLFQEDPEGIKKA